MKRLLAAILVLGVVAGAGFLVWSAWIRDTGPQYTVVLDNAFGLI